MASLWRQQSSPDGWPNSRVIRSACTLRHWPRLANVAPGATVLADRSRGTPPPAVVPRCLCLMDLVDCPTHTNIASVMLLNMWSSTRRPPTATPADTLARSSRGLSVGVGRSAAAGGYGPRWLVCTAVSGSNTSDIFHLELRGRSATSCFTCIPASSLPPWPGHSDRCTFLHVCPCTSSSRYSLSVASALTASHGPSPPSPHQLPSLS